MFLCVIHFLWTFFFECFVSAMFKKNKQTDSITDKPRKKEISIFSFFINTKSNNDILGAETAAILQACYGPASTIQLLYSNIQG